MNWKKLYRRCDDPVECVKSFMIAFNKDLLIHKAGHVIKFYREQAHGMAEVERDFLFGRRLNKQWFEHCVTDITMKAAVKKNSEDQTKNKITSFFGEPDTIDENYCCLYRYSCIEDDIFILLDVVFEFKTGQFFKSSKKVVWRVDGVGEKIVLNNGSRNLTMSRGRVLDMDVSRETF